MLSAAYANDVLKKQKTHTRAMCGYKVRGEWKNTREVLGESRRGEILYTSLVSYHYPSTK